MEFIIPNSPSCQVTFERLASTFNLNVKYVRVEKNNLYRVVEVHALKDEKTKAYLDGCADALCEVFVTTI